MQKLCIIILLLMSSCSNFQGRHDHTERCSIRYASLTSVYTFFLNRDPEALKLTEQLADARSKIDKLKADIRIHDRPDLRALLQKEQNNRDSLTAGIELLKAGLLKKIHSAADRYADKNAVDLILDSGRQVLYGRDTLDITEELIREVIRIDKRSAPVSR